MSRYHNTFAKIDDVTYQGQSANGAIFLFDAEDFSKVSQYYWHVKARGAVIAHINGHTVSMHRWLLNPPSEQVVDHINRNPHDNRKSNLRLCTQKDNTHNRSAFSRNGKRVGVIAHRKKFLAYITHDGISMRKEFKTYEEALAQREAWEEELFGEFAPNDGNNEQKIKESAEKEISKHVKKLKASKREYRITNLLRGFGYNSIVLSDVLQCDRKCAQKKLANPGTFTERDFRLIANDGILDLECLLHYFKEDFL